MYCRDVDLFKQGKGQRCGTSDGHIYGDCAEGLECFAHLPGAPSTCQEVGQPEGKQCGLSASSGYFFGDCSPGLGCEPPAPGSAPGTPSTCIPQPLSPLRGGPWTSVNITLGIPGFLSASSSGDGSVLVTGTPLAGICQWNSMYDDQKLKNDSYKITCDAISDQLNVFGDTMDAIMKCKYEQQGRACTQQADCAMNGTDQDVGACQSHRDGSRSCTINAWIAKSTLCSPR
jgi:hypothetical protein